ncbi:hypothetical protein ABT272_45050 [Streptomyces sp900105245]|uniref:Uncharacterized protein n=1 Tax=Streptomyces sp. 900105245 TaxID=3154379 RepID=A0ABV1ULN9_9ACTN
MTMTPAELEAQRETLELLNNEVAARLTRKSDSLAKIDSKAVLLIRFAATPPSSWRCTSTTAGTVCKPSGRVISTLA